MNNENPIRSTSSNMDPSGILVEHKDHFLRGISSPLDNFFYSLLNNGLINEMIGHEIIETEISHKKNDAFPLILKHRKLEPVNYCYEWPPIMLKDAALQTLNICLKLVVKGLNLRDASPWNILFEHTRPFFVGFGSIMPQEEGLLWGALDQFYRLFLFPLLVADQGLGRVSRSSLLQSKQGISDSDVVKFIPKFYWLKKPWLVNRLYLPRILISLLRSSGYDKNIKKYIVEKSVTTNQRIAFFQSLIDNITSIHFNFTKSRWSLYYEDINQFFQPPEFHQKQKTIADLLQKLNAQSIIDIGCNQGGYSFLAAQAGASVIAFDTDEDSITMLYQMAKEKNFNILPLVMDVTNPSPATGFRENQSRSAFDRFRSEGALALALTHHLAITQNQSFDFIAKELSEYCKKWLITEYVPLSDPRAKELLATSRRDMGWYSLNAFTKALKNEFFDVSTFDSYPEGRVLCLCKK